MQTLTIDTPEGACDIYAARSRYSNGTLAVVLAHASAGRLLGPLTVNLQPYGARGQSARRAYVRSRQAESPLVKGALPPTPPVRAYPDNPAARAAQSERQSTTHHLKEMGL